MRRVRRFARVDPEIAHWEVPGGGPPCRRNAQRHCARDSSRGSGRRGSDPARDGRGSRRVRGDDRRSPQGSDRARSLCRDDAGGPPNGQRGHARTCSMACIASSRPKAGALIGSVGSTTWSVRRIGSGRSHSGGRQRTRRETSSRRRCHRTRSSHRQWPRCNGSCRRPQRGSSCFQAGLRHDDLYSAAASRSGWTACASKICATSLRRACSPTACRLQRCPIVLVTLVRQRRSIGTRSGCRSRIRTQRTGCTVCSRNRAAGPRYQSRLARLWGLIELGHAGNAKPRPHATEGIERDRGVGITLPSSIVSFNPAVEPLVSTARLST